MVIKVKDITKAFSKRQVAPGVFEKSAIDQMVDGVKDFGRKMQIHYAYAELKDMNELFEKERQAIVKSLIEEYCNESKENAEEVAELPNAYLPKYTKKVEEILEKEYTPKKALKFTQKELQESGLPVSLWGNILFLLHPLKDSPK